jgi:hypothetical protein
MNYRARTMRLQVGNRNLTNYFPPKDKEIEKKIGMVALLGKYQDNIL